MVLVSIKEKEVNLEMFNIGLSSGRGTKLWMEELHFRIKFLLLSENKWS